MILTSAAAPTAPAGWRRSRSSSARSPSAWCSARNSSLLDERPGVAVPRGGAADVHLEVDLGHAVAVEISTGVDDAGCRRDLLPLILEILRHAHAEPGA